MPELVLAAFICTSFATDHALLANDLQENAGEIILAL